MARPTFCRCEDCSAPITVAATGPLPSVCVSCKMRRESTRAAERHRAQRAEARAIAIGERLRPELSRIAKFEAATAVEPLRRDLDTMSARVEKLLREVASLRERLTA